jgi:hypothetical protein
MFAWLGRISSTLVQLLTTLGVILLVWAFYLADADWLGDLRAHASKLGAPGLTLVIAACFLVAAFVISSVRPSHGTGRRPLFTIRPWVVLVGMVFVGVSVWAATTWLLSEADRAAPADRVASRIDAIRTGLTVGAGAGGGVALLLAARKQWLSERSQVHEESVADTQYEDALERRITDFYTKAVEQLGSGKAPVRLGGLYSLERLAAEHTRYRQMIVDVLCAYLRMPADDDVAEPSVRATAQRIVHRNLVDTRDATQPLWQDLHIDLSGAVLHDFVLENCRVRGLDLSDVRFTGNARLAGISTRRRITLARAQFERNVDLSSLRNVNLTDVLIYADSFGRATLPSGWLATVADAEGYLRVYDYARRAVWS